MLQTSQKYAVMVAGWISQIPRLSGANSRRRRLGRAGLKHLASDPAEILEDRVLLSADPGYGSWGGDAIAVSGLAFDITDYGYGSAIGELTGGIVNGSGIRGMYKMEIDIEADGTIEWTDETLNDVSGIWAELDLPYTHNRPGGTIPVAVRMSETAPGVSLEGSWVTGNIAVLPPENAAPIVDNLKYTPWDMGYGLSGYLSGDITDATPEFGIYELQIDADSDGQSDYSLTDTDSEDRTAFLYKYNPVQGLQTVAVRIRETDVNTGQLLNGAWTSLSFTPVLPENEAPEIDYLDAQWVSHTVRVYDEPDGGYGGYGGYPVNNYGGSSGNGVWQGTGSYHDVTYTYLNLKGEFEDFSRDASSYEFQVDANGDGYPETMIGVGNDFRFNFGGADNISQIRIKESDAFGRLYHSAWTAVVSFGTPNAHRPEIGGPREVVLSALALTQGQNVGTWPATDADAGDQLRYKLEVAGLRSAFYPKGTSPDPLLKINATTGAVQVTNPERLKKILEEFGNMPFRIKVTDGKVTVGANITIVDDPERYFDEADNHIERWLVYATVLVKDLELRTKAAFNDLKDFSATVNAGHSTLLTIANTTTNLLWSGAAFFATKHPTAAAVAGVAAVVAQSVLNIAIERAKAQEAENGAMTVAQILNSYNTISEELADSEVAAILQKSEDESALLAVAEAKLYEKVEYRVNAARAYLKQLKLRLEVPEPEKRPVIRTEKIYGALLVKYCIAKGWEIRGSEWHLKNKQTYWFQPTYVFGGNNDTAALVDELNGTNYTHWAGAVLVNANGLRITRIFPSQSGL